MDAALAIFAAWSAGIFAVIEALGRTPAGQSAWWARLLPVLPLALGGLSGPTMVPLAADHLEWLADVGTVGAVLIGIGAGAVAASGHSTTKQTVQGRDRRIRRMGEGAGGKRDSRLDISDALKGE